WAVACGIVGGATVRAAWVAPPEPRTCRSMAARAGVALGAHGAARARDRGGDRARVRARSAVAAARPGEPGGHVRGGRGPPSRRTPAELVAIGERTGIDGASLARDSRLVAKVDSAAIQDGHQL